MKRHLLLLVPLLLLRAAAAAAVPNSPKWLTLSGEAPLVIARGGYSGLFPESSQYAYQYAMSTSLKNVVLFCDYQMLKDGSTICHSDLRLDNSTTISAAFPKGQKTYTVNGEQIRGWFAVDFTAEQIFNNVTLIQSIFSRTSVFDNNLPLLSVEDVIELRPSHFWLNVQYSSFFAKHVLDPTGYVSDAIRQITIDYVSSPEIGFLKGLNGKLRGVKTKLIFRFLDEDAVEPSTNQTYSSLLKDLNTIKSFASGILVPKNYIWPVTKDLYLEPPTTLVADAHGLGLEVYAYNFANDFPASYNYSYDPTAEYLQFIDNSNFSVDGVLTDFPSTASEAVACLAHNNDDIPRKGGRPLIVTHNGASGDFAGCTDLAYQKAVKDGADVIDCSVQMSKDGVAFCLGSPDLMGKTTAVDSFMSRVTTVPEIQQNSGIFSFDLAWSEIQSLKPADLVNLLGMLRNPAAKNLGEFMTLADFLDFAKNSRVSGVLINIENAPYLASKKGLDIVNAVSGALTNASYDTQTNQQVLIQSDDTAVLSTFKKYPTYKRVLNIKQVISDTPKPAVDEIKQSAEAVNIPRESITAHVGFFLSGFTDVVKELHAANISVYVSVLRNEYSMIAYDFFSDPFVEIATYVWGVRVDGIVTEFPATATAYFRSPCSDANAKLPYTIQPAEPGYLLSMAPPDAAGPANPPSPILDASDVVDPPLPPVADLSEKSTPPAATPPAPTQPSGQPATSANAVVYLLAVVLSIIYLSYH